MKRSRNEQTIAQACEVSGRGYWSGDEIRVTMRPAAAGTGVVFVRKDLPGQPSCPATVENRYDTQLRTVIQHGEARIEMIEHLMAALYALEIDNCLVEINGIELPGLDGSSDAYVKALQNAGRVVQASQRRQWVVDQTIRVAVADRWIQVEPTSTQQHDASGQQRCYFEYQLSFDVAGPIPGQTFGFDCDPSSFVREVSRARTFVTKSQADSLRAQGVAGHVSNRDLLVFDNDGPVDNSLRYDNECARHKTLDLIGDLALMRFDLIGRVTSFRGGHNLNGLLAEKIVSVANTSALGDDANTHGKAATDRNAA